VVLVTCFVYIFALKMERAYFSAMSANFHRLRAVVSVFVQLTAYKKPFT
jgi:hypothetical protein